MHVDDFIDGEFTEHCYARWMFNHFRLPAVLRADFDQFMERYKLFCTYEGVRYRVTGASRLGDVWLTTDFQQDHGYQKRVDIEKCSEWSDSQ